MTDQERIEQLEAENLKMREALEDISYQEKTDGYWITFKNAILNITSHGPIVRKNIQDHCEKIYKALQETPNTTQLAKQREADLAVIRFAKHGLNSIGPVGQNSVWFCLQETLAAREKVYEEGK